MENTYILVPWPNCQELMDEEWFDEEAILSDDSSFFIPKTRYLEFMRKLEIEAGDRLVCKKCGSDNFTEESYINYLTNEVDLDYYIDQPKISCNNCDEKETSIEPMGKFIVHGYLTLTNIGGIEMQISDCGNMARLKFTNNDLPSQWLMIRTGPDASGYVNYNGISYFLKEFIRTNI